jgi:hypothetical protein
MFQLYKLMGFVSLIQIFYGISCFQQLRRPHQIYVIGAAVAFCLWLFSYTLSTFKLGDTQPLHYLTPVLCSIMQGFFYKAALKSYNWSRFLTLLPLLVVGYITVDLYVFGQRAMAIDLMIYINAIICVLGFFLQNDLLTTKSDLKRNGLLWLNSANLLSALLGVLSNLLLNRLFQYQNNEYFSLLYYGFWAIFGVFNTFIVTYSIFLDSRKIPSLEKMPSFER